MTHQLNPDALVAEACQATGLDRFDSESYREGLEIYCADFNKLAPSEQAVAGSAAAIVKVLSDRLRVNDYLRGRPELLERPVEAPVFVFGSARTGTTLLNNLLAADPARRSALAWEIDDPVPPPTAATLFNDPRALKRLEDHRRLLATNPEMGKYYRSSPIYPNECIFMMNGDFKTLFWEGRGKLPNYRDWLFSTDMTSAYAYHKRFLQLLQADAPGHWNLKKPSHGLWLETLLKIYPDAKLIWTHRDPLASTGSFCSLMKLAMYGSLGTVDLEWISQNFSWQAVEHVERIMNSRANIGHDRIVDVHYADLMRDPIGAMRRLYAALGDEFTPEAEAGMQAWIDDNPQGKFGRHDYKLAEFGLTADGVRKRFERYLSEYDVEPEG